MNLAAFFLFVLLTSITPGPNNIMSMSNALKYGLKGSVSFLLGILAGFVCVMAACALFSALLYDIIPSVRPAMMCVGTAYLLWLAWKVWRDTGEEAKAGTLRANSFATGMSLQFVNIKIILYGITAMSSYILPYYRSLPAVTGFVLLLAASGFIGSCCWAVFGEAFERLFKKYRGPVNTVMALMLVYCSLAILSDL